MIDIHTERPVFKWVCILLFMLVTLFYFRGCGVRLHGGGWQICSLFSNEWSLWDTAIGATRPILNLCFTLAYKAGGHDHLHLVFHISQRLAHLIASLLVFLLIRRLTYNTLVGMSSAMLFASFYIGRDTVLPCVRIPDVMLCVFWLLSIVFYIRYFDGKGLYNYLLSLISFCLAFFSKENGIFLIGCIFLVDTYLRKEVAEKGGPWRNGLKIRGVVTCLPFVLLSITYFMFLSHYCHKTSALSSLETFAWLKSGTPLIWCANFFRLSMLPVHAEDLRVKLFVGLLIATVYIFSDKGTRRLMQLLVLCGLPPLTVYLFLYPAGSIGHEGYVYTTSAFTMGLIACVINQGAEKLSGLSTVQHFFLETFKRRLLATMVVCWLIIHYGLTMYTHDVYIVPLHVYIMSLLSPPFKYGTMYLLLIVSLALLGLLVVYARSGQGVRGFVQITALCTSILMIPALSPNFQGMFSYFLAVLFMSLLACALGHVAERILSLRIADFQDPRKVFFALLLLAYSSIILVNYDDVRTRIKGEIIQQKIRDLTARPLRGIVLQNEGYRDKTVYLLNFQHIGWFKSGPEGMLFSGSAPKKWIAYSCGLDLNAFDGMDTLPGRIMQYKMALGGSKYFGPSTHLEMSAEEFDRLTKDSNNKMLLFDQETLQVLDVSGMDFSSVRDIMSDEERQKAFILR